MRVSQIFSTGGGGGCGHGNDDWHGGHYGHDSGWYGGGYGGHGWHESSYRHGYHDHYRGYRDGLLGIHIVL